MVNKVERIELLKKEKEKFLSVLSQMWDEFLTDEYITSYNNEGGDIREIKMIDSIKAEIQTCEIQIHLKLESNWEQKRPGA